MFRNMCKSFCLCNHAFKICHLTDNFDTFCFRALHNKLGMKLFTLHLSLHYIEDSFYSLLCYTEKIKSCVPVPFYDY